MSETSTLGIILGFAGVCVTQLAFWADGRRQSAKQSATTDGKIDEVGANADVAATEAATAAERAKPVSNGFAAEVRTGIAEVIRGVGDLSAEVHEVRQKLDAHIGDHASADVARRMGRRG